MKKEKNIDQFSRDSKNNDGYLYTNTEQLSCKVANKRLSDAVLQITGSLKGKSMIDIGCGDGKYTIEFLKHDPKTILAIDPAIDAIRTANKKYRQTKIKFEIGNIYELSKIKKTFDVAIVRGVLHHLYQPEIAIKQLSTIAKTVVIIEPNGYNPILKIIEKLSPYHRQHEEKSYLPTNLKQWLKTNGGVINSETYCGIVPFFCPDTLVRLLKKVEPIFESLPYINRFFCAVYITNTSFMIKLSASARNPASHRVG